MSDKIAEPMNSNSQCYLHTWRWISEGTSTELKVFAYGELID